MTKKKTATKTDSGKKYLVTRGITNDKERIEAGSVVTMAELKKLFDDQTIAHWQGRGIITDG